MNRIEWDSDSRWLFRAYAWMIGISGFLVFAWGPMFFHPRIGPELMADAALTRIFGGLLVAAACMAAAVVPVESPATLRRACGWFALAHAAVWSVVALQEKTIGPGFTAMWASNLLIGVGCVFFYFWFYPEGQPDYAVKLTSLFGAEEREGPHRRNQYEEQIRLAASQEERHRLARDLHDSVKQQLFVIQTAAATAEARFDSDHPGAQEAIGQVRSASREAIAEMQAMLDQLQAAPLENTGLVAALKKQVEALSFRTGAKVEFDIGELPASSLFAPGTQDSVFRVGQEALSNVARHARAKHVWVSLSTAAGMLTLRVRDDGSGFDTNSAPPGMGLSNIRARASEFGGMFEVESASGAGTTISFSVPYETRQWNVKKEALAAAAWFSVLCLLCFLMVRNSKSSNGWVLGFSAFQTINSAIRLLHARAAKARRS